MARTIAVTGAASGLGKAIVQQLDETGARVVGVDIAGTEIGADLSSAGGRAAAIAGILVACDGHLDGLVPCAGVGTHLPGERIIAINYFGAAVLLDGLIEALASGANPAVVMISSNSTTMTPGSAGPLAEACLEGDEEAALALAADAHPAVAYANAKVAIAKLVRSRAAELGARGVRINSVAPGAFDTPLLQAGLDDPATSELIKAIPIPLGRRGKPDEIARVVTWLLSEDAHYVHGSNLFVDGGTDAQLFPTRFP